MNTADPLLGRQLANFRVERLIGRGGMATVYYGQDVKLGRPVAIKVMNARSQDDPSLAKRLVKEASLMASWRHENIVQVYYADDEEGFSYFVMEYIPGQSLGELLAEYAQKGQRMPQEEALRIGRAVAAALDYAHERGVIHRDVKPSNVLIAEDGRVVLSDFGLALQTAEGTIGEVFGSPHYIAPEQARNSAEARPQSDLYSLGVMLYQMLSGVLPFDDPSPMSLALQHLIAPPPSPRRANPALNQATEEVLLKALAKSPAERYQSGKELLDALESALKAEETATLPPGPRPPARPPASRQEGRPAPGFLTRGGLWLLTCSGLLGLAALGLMLIVSLGRGLKPPAPVTLQAGEARAEITPSLPPVLASPTASPAPAATLPTPIAPGATASPSAETPSPTASATPLPPSPSPTSPPPEGDLFLLFYDETAFYAKNASERDRSVYPLAFERLDTEGNPLNRFEGWRWGNIYSTFHQGYCMVMKFVELGEHLNPPACQDRLLVLHQPTMDRDYIFWTSREGSAYFRVLWREVEAGRCEIAAGYCEVYLPFP